MKRLLLLVLMSFFKQISVIPVALLFPFNAKAQEMAVKVYTAADGLPTAAIYGAFPDKQGYLWIGSSQGMARFDGSNFIKYGLAHGLTDSRALLSLIDSKKRYWILTPRSIFQFKGNRFIPCSFEDSENIRWVFKIIETGDQNIWALTGSGIYQFNSGKWEKIILYPGYKNHTCRSIIETKDGLYINYGNLLVLIKPDNTSKIIGAYQKFDFYYNNFMLLNGDLFVSTLNGIYKISNQKLVKLHGALGKLKGNYTYFQDSKKNSWVGEFGAGIQLLDSKDSTRLITVYKGQSNSLPFNFCEDEHGNVWAGYGSTLIKLSEQKFKKFDLPLLFGNSFVFNVLQPPSAPMFVNNGSMTTFEFKNNTFSAKKIQNGGGIPLPNNELIIDNYAFDNRGRYWYYLRGFSLAMQQNNKVYVQSKRLSHIGDEVFDVLFHSYRKKIIVAVRTQQSPCEYDGTMYKPMLFKRTAEVKGEIMKLHQCKNGVLLFATDKGYIYSVDTLNICRFQLHEFGNQGIVNKFYNDADGNIWILYTSKNLRRYSWQKDTLIFQEEITEIGEFLSENITSICFDNRNNLWVCTGSSVVVFTKNDRSNEPTFRVVSFFSPKDLQIEGAPEGSLMKDKEGMIWYFSLKHLICFYPDKIKLNSPPPRIEIERIELNLQKTNWTTYADSLYGIFQVPYDLKLSYKNNTIGFYFKGINSSGSAGVSYIYRLQGLNTLWSTPSSNDYVSFVKLPPGKYVFEVKAKLPNTPWSKTAFFSFEIQHAFWQTWWFYLLVALALTAGIYSLFRYRLQQKVKLLEIRNTFSRDLHDELGSSVSGINLLSQIASEKLENNEPEEASAYLTKVKIYSSEVIEKLSDMAWVFNPDNDSIGKLLQRLKIFSISIANLKNIQVQFLTDNDIEALNLSIQQRKAIYLISKEAINNAVKYANCSTIIYELGLINNCIRLTIRDNGEGFEEQSDNEGNGLRNIRARALEIKANIEIKSQPGNGTVIQLQLPPIEG